MPAPAATSHRPEPVDTGVSDPATAELHPVEPAVAGPRWLEGPADLAPLLLRAGELRPLLAVGTPGGAARNSVLLHVDLGEVGPGGDRQGENEGEPPLLACHLRSGLP